MLSKGRKSVFTEKGGKSIFNVTEITIIKGGNKNFF